MWKILLTIVLTAVFLWYVFRPLIKKWLKKNEIETAFQRQINMQQLADRWRSIHIGEIPAKTDAEKAIHALPRIALERKIKRQWIALGFVEKGQASLSNYIESLTVVPPQVEEAPKRKQWVENEGSSYAFDWELKTIVG